MLSPTLKNVQVLRNEGKTKEEISEILNISESTAKRYLSKVKEYEREYEDTEKDIDIEEISEIENYKAQVKYWKTQYNKVISQSSLESKLISLLDTNLEKYPYIPLKEKSHSDTTKEILHLNLSDWHIGENVSSEELFGMNEYNIDIIKDRAQNLYNSVCNILSKMQGYEYDTIHVNILGDMVSGIIHEELIANGINITEQIIFGAEIISDIIFKISQKIPNVVVTGVIGNHGRMKKKPYYKEKYNNFDFILYKFIETKCENLKNVSFTFPKSFFAIIENWDWNLLLMHGDGINSFGGIPHYGIKRMDSNMSQVMTTQLNKYPNYILMGHYHTSNSLEKMGGEIIMNGSLKGSDEFSLGRMFVGGNPSQLLFSLHPEHGITWRFTLNCK